MNRTTTKDFKSFCDEFKYWVEVFGVLKGWDLEFVFSEVEEHACAAVQCYHDSKCVTVNFYRLWYDTTINDYSIRRTAFHEVLELLFDDVEHLITVKKNRELARKEVHILINVFILTLFNDSYIKRYGKIPQ